MRYECYELLVVVALAAMRYVPSFPEDDGERM